MAIKICYFTSKNDNDIRVFHKECTSLVKAGYDVSMVCPNARDRIQNGVKIYGVEYKDKGERARFFKLPKLLYQKALSLDADIYHFNDPASVPYGVKLKNMGKKVIFDAFEDHPSMWMNRGTGIKGILCKLIGWGYKQYELAQAKKFDAVFVCYHWTKDRLSRVNPNVELVLNFPIIDNKEIKERPLRTTDNVSVCYAGTICNDWNIPTVIDAVDKLSGVSFNLAGWTGDSLMNSMKSQRGWSKVAFFGKLTRDEVITQVYDKSDIGIALFNYSPLCNGKVGNMSNNKLFEYLLMGMPVLCTDFDLWKEVVEGNKCGICVNPSDSGAIADAIKYIKEHPEESYQMGLNGQRAVLEKYNWNSQEAILFEVYKRIL